MRHVGGARARVQAHDAHRQARRTHARTPARPPTRTDHPLCMGSSQTKHGWEDALYIYSKPAAGAVLEVVGARLDNLEVVLAGRGARRKRIQALSQGCRGIQCVSGPGDSGR
jgi:hypothetical protein